MSDFEKYRRTNIADMRNVTDNDIEWHMRLGRLPIPSEDGDPIDEQPSISISNEDLKNGSPKIGDMIARNPENHDDQWLVAKDYFQANFAKA